MPPTPNKPKTGSKIKATCKKKEIELSDTGDEGLATKGDRDDEAGDDADDKVDWKDNDLNWSLITILEEDQAIRQGLFPVPGANISVSQGGSKPKTDYQWMLAQRLFESHDKYKDAFALVQTPADKANWQRKIKNRIKRMTQDVRKYRDMMGETGAGIMHENDIDMECNNSLTQSWAAIKEKCPWFFKLKAIIDERPSAVPVGVGNNGSGYDVSILAPNGNPSEFDLSDPGLGLDTSYGDGKGDSDDNENGDGDGDGNSDENGDRDSEGSDDEGGIKTTAVTKRKAAPVEGPEVKTLKTSARAGKSTPATMASRRPSKKPRTGLEKLNALAAKEEETTQKALDLKKLKATGENEKALARIKSRGDVKMQRMKLRAELAKKKMDNDLQLQMAQMGAARAMGHMYTHAGSSSMVYSNTGSGSVTPSIYSNNVPQLSGSGSVTPSTYSNNMPQLDPSLEYVNHNTSNTSYDFTNL
ncbi:hypothetical protein M378DRAFT_182413 [Amanita muscaria Koide BX008]|uniref:Uncharacterized protein n=1 Tax=Amanita muscaria (strain Koide BX008) TaxID=946122 RepID=A0A0C2WF94_AMAMK|nr:hypothetical protein M378DRAFT_182413 [Amanita muscaria Koide BX008]